ncbi:Peroxin-13 [Plasmodiophora brassicae]
MALVSPPKPWERQAAESHAATSLAASSPTTTAMTPPVAALPVASSPSYPATSAVPYSYGGFPSYSSYGSSYTSPYASSSYGRTSSYGGIGYMTPGAGSLPPPHPLDMYKGTPITSLVSGGQSFITGIHQHVSSFGRFSQILHMNFEALHMSFSSIMQLLTNASMLRHELGAFFGTFGSLRIIYVIYSRCRSLILRLLGRRSEAVSHELDHVWREAKHGTWGWLPSFLTMSLALWVMKKVVAHLSNSRRPATQAPPTASSTPSPSGWSPPSPTQSDWSRSPTYTSTPWSPPYNHTYPQTYPAQYATATAYPGGMHHRPYDHHQFAGLYPNAALP